MRQLSTIILVIFVMLVFKTSAFGVYKTGINYSIPIEYKNLSEVELKTKADKYFQLSQPSNNGIVTEDTTNALILYSVLKSMLPSPILA